MLDASPGLSVGWMAKMFDAIEHRICIYTKQFCCRMFSYLDLYVSIRSSEVRRYIFDFSNDLNLGMRHHMISL